MTSIHCLRLRHNPIGSSLDSSPPQAPQSNPSMDPDFYLKEGIEGVEEQQFRDTRSVTRAIKSQADKLSAGSPGIGQYAVFSSVSLDELTNLERIRDANYKYLRFLYLDDAETLIVKISPGASYEVSTGALVKTVLEKVEAMALGWEVVDMRATAYQGVASKKEADSALKPIARSRKIDFPTVVFECGLSESLRRLRAEANWWLECTESAVKIVILISVSPEQRKIHLEQWETRTLQNPSVTRANNSPQLTTPTKIHEIDITTPLVGGPVIPPALVDGAPLILDFTKITLRKPGPSEGNVICTAEDLAHFATSVWQFTK